MNEQLDRARGALVGVTVGDCLGATLEFLAPSQIRERYGVHQEIVGGGVMGWAAGEGTDDTDLTIAVARTYSEGYSLERVAEHCLRWFHGNPRDIGTMAQQTLHRIDQGGDPRTSAAAVAADTDDHRVAGNGSLMRAIPTAVAVSDRAKRIRHAREISALTHSDPRCVDACVAYVELAAGLIGGATAATVIRRTLDELDLVPPVRDALTVTAATPVDAIATSGYVLDSLTAAAWAIQQPPTAEHTLIALVNRGADADTTGAIAGGLLGARDGLDALPARWVDQCQAAAELRELADQLSR